MCPFIHSFIRSQFFCSNWWFFFSIMFFNKITESKTLSLFKHYDFISWSQTKWIIGWFWPNSPALKIDLHRNLWILSFLSFHSIHRIMHTSCISLLTPLNYIHGMHNNSNHILNVFTRISNETVFIISQTKNKKEKVFFFFFVDLFFFSSLLLCEFYSIREYDGFFSLFVVLLTIWNLALN